MKRGSKISIVITLVIILFIATLISSFYLTSYFYPSENVVTSSQPNIQVIGKTDYGEVVKEGPFGNASSPVKIAYIVGVHPEESSAHQLFLESFNKYKSSLRYCYYIYKVNVTQDVADYEKGRMNGQLLANKFAVPDIEKQKFQLAVDIHSHKGEYSVWRFVFAPVNGSTSEAIALEIKNKISWLQYYVPPNPTSPSYITIPLIQSGTPAILYETYDYDANETTKNHDEEFILTVDNLKLV